MQTAREIVRFARISARHHNENRLAEVRHPWSLSVVGWCYDGAFRAARRDAVATCRDFLASGAPVDQRRKVVNALRILRNANAAVAK